MHEQPNVIPFCVDAFSALAGHTVCQGGMPMKVTHQHPAYTNEQERLSQLRELKKQCLVKLHGLRDHKTA